MEGQELLTSPEKEKQPKYEAIIIFGRGIGKDEKGKWHPTPYVEELKGGQHLGIFKTKVDTENGGTYIGGTNANVLAAVQLFEELANAGNPPKLIIFAAGRPDYLSKEPPWVSEGRVLEEKFRLKTQQFESPIQTAVLEQNKNTRDDVEQSLRMAASYGLSKVAIITVGLHIPRSEEFLKLVQKGDKALANLEVDLLAAEEILARRDKRYTKIFKLAKGTKAYKRTLLREQEGVRKLRTGRYKSNSQGYRF